MRGVSCRHLVWRQCAGSLEVWRLTPRVGVSLPSTGSDQHQLAATSPPCARMRYGVGTIACSSTAECDAGERAQNLLLFQVVATEQLRRPTGTGQVWFALFSQSCVSPILTTLLLLFHRQLLASQADPHLHPAVLFNGTCQGSIEKGVQSGSS